MDTPYSFVNGHGVPGGHYAFHNEGKEPFVTPMKECLSIDLRESDVVVDIGAYVGAFSLLCARRPVKKVVAYEPTPETFDVLKLNAAQLPNLELVRAAVVWDDRDDINLFLSSGIGVTNSVVLDNRKTGMVRVPAVSYRAAVRGASVVKIDVEGAEYAYPIVQPSLRAVIIDFHPIPNRNWPAKATSIIEDLEAAGFEAVVEPDFSCGWTRAGSWVRPMETSGRCDLLVNGERCCGCGRMVHADEPRKTLCSDCYERWRPNDRNGYQKEREE